MGYLPHYVAGCRTIRSGSDKVRSSQDSVNSFIKLIYPEDIATNSVDYEKNTEICEIKL